MMNEISLKPLPNKEALAFWQDKVQLGAGQLAKLSDAEKVRAFAVSGIAKGDELDQVFQSLSKGLKEGTPFEEWKKSLSSVWEKRGWTGKADWRIDNIFRTNIQTAFHVGRYQQMMQVTKARPFWMYDAINDSRTRPAHRAMDGKIYPYDSPFWDTWYPPNGFRCRCGVSTLSAREIERDGLKVETDDITGTLIEPTTPEGVKMPARLLMPDPGFANNAAKSVWDPITGIIRDRTEGWPVDISRMILVEMAGGPVFESWYRKPEGLFPLAVMDDEAAGLIGAKTRTVVISSTTAEKQIAQHPELSASEYVFVQQAIQSGQRIQDTEKTLIYVLDAPDGYVTVVKSTISGEEIFMTSFRRLSKKAALKEKTIARLLKKGK